MMRREGWRGVVWMSMWDDVALVHVADCRLCPPPENFRF